MAFAFTLTTTGLDMMISEDMTLSEALAMHGIVLKPGNNRCKRRLYRAGEYTGSVNAFQGWALVAALSARSMLEAAE